jgi:hypothetical protein
MQIKLNEVVVKKVLLELSEDEAATLKSVLEKNLLDLWDFAGDQESLIRQVVAGIDNLTLPKGMVLHER